MGIYENTGKAISTTEVKDEHRTGTIFKGLVPTFIGLLVFTLVFALIARYIEFRLGISF